MKKAIVPIICFMVLVIMAGYLVTTAYKKPNPATTTAADGEAAEAVETEQLVTLDELSAEDTVILMGKDVEKKIFTVRRISSGEEYELSYDSSMPMLNRSGGSITATELSCGEILDIVYSKHSGKVNRVQISSGNWTLTDMTEFEIDERMKKITLMGEAYQFDSNVPVFSDDHQVELMDVTEMDTLIVKGYNRKVSSVIVDKGHGYLRIKNDAYFVGGFIEVGQKIIRPITEEMLLPVPEGKYKVRVTNRGYAGEENVEIKRDEETKLDLSKIEIEEVAIGHIQFELSPAYAQLYVDGEITDYEERVPLEYGTHKIRVEAAGYKTVETNIKIGNDYANVEIALDVSDTVEEATDKTPEGAQNQSATTADSVADTQDTESDSSDDTSEISTISGSHKIIVEQPEGVEVYLDGNYIGVAPISTAKVTGSHTITLSKSGYQTKSYTIYVDSMNSDVTLSFSELLVEE